MEGNVNGEHEIAGWQTGDLIRMAEEAKRLIRERANSGDPVALGYLRAKQQKASGLSKVRRMRISPPGGPGT